MILSMFYSLFLFGVIVFDLLQPSLTYCVSIPCRNLMVTRIKISNISCV